MPVWLVQGRQDMVCPPVTAYELHQKLPDGNLIWTTSGHKSERESSERQTNHLVTTKQRRVSMNKKFAVFDIDGTIIRTALFLQIVDELLAARHLDKSYGLDWIPSSKHTVPVPIGRLFRIITKPR